MTKQIGMAGRPARSMPLDRKRITGVIHGPAPAPSAIPEAPLPLVQRLSASQFPTEGEGDSPSPNATEMGAAAIERETPSPSPEEVADRVYQLLCQDLRWERERRGRS